MPDESRPTPTGELPEIQDSVRCPTCSTDVTVFVPDEEKIVSRLTEAEQRIEELEGAICHELERHGRGLTGMDAEVLKLALSDHGSVCDHKWVDMRNEDSDSGEYCWKCNVIRSDHGSEGE